MVTTKAGPGVRRAKLALRRARAPGKAALKDDDATTRRVSQLTETGILTKETNDATAARRDGGPCKLYYQEGRKQACCLERHATEEHFQVVADYIRQRWEVCDAEEVIEDYGLEAVTAAAHRWWQAKPERFRNPSGFFMSRLNKNNAPEGAGTADRGLEAKDGHPQLQPDYTRTAPHRRTGG